MAKTIRLKKIALKPKFKYSINEQVGKLPRNTTIAEVIEHLKTSNISKDEFYRDRAIPFGSDKSISSDRLLIYCKVFDCTIDDLINHEVKATSIRAKHLSNSKLNSSLK